jgi:hypothetical protein
MKSAAASSEMYVRQKHVACPICRKARYARFPTCPFCPSAEVAAPAIVASTPRVPADASTGDLIEIESGPALHDAEDELE